jgi:deoxyguanosine kinase
MSLGKQPTRFHISILGSVGTGKSTLAKLIQQRVDCTLYLEEPEDHPFLRLFFGAPQLWGFANVLSFAMNKFAQQGHILSHEQLAVQEVDAFANHSIWTPVMHEIGYISQAEMAAICQVYEILSTAPISTPDLRIILQVSLEAQLDRIRKRDREYEDLDPAFVQLIEMLGESFAEFTQNLSGNLMMIDTETVDFTKPSLVLDGLLDDIVNCVPCL